MKQILLASNDDERASIENDTDDDEAEWHKTGSICDTGCGGNCLRGRVYGPILTLNGHNFYGWLVTNTFYNLNKYICKSGGRDVMSLESENFQN